MPISPEIINYYDHLSEQIDENRQTVDSVNTSMAPGDIEVPKEFQINLAFNVAKMKALDELMLPSHALFMHMTNLQQAVHGWRYKASVDDEDERAAVATLKASISQALIWFKHSFVGRLYSEVDEHQVNLSFDDESEPVVSLNVMTTALTAWFGSLETLAGKDFTLPSEASDFDDAHVHMQRVNAAHKRIAKARQAQWLTNNAVYGYYQLGGRIDALIERELMSDTITNTQAIASVSSGKLAEYSALYQRFQPYLTNIDEHSPLSLSEHSQQNVTFSKQLDSDICYALQGVDKSGQTFKTNKALDKKLAHGLGPMSFCDGISDYDGQQPLKTLIKREQSRLSYLVGDDLSELSNKNMAVIADVFERVSARTKQAFSGNDLNDLRLKHQSDSFELRVSDGSSQELFNTLENIERVRCELHFSEQVINELHQLLSENRRIPSASIEEGVQHQIRNHIALLQTLFHGADDIELESDLTFADVLNRLQVFIDNDDELGGVSCDHCVTLLEKSLQYLNGDPDVIESFQKMVESASDLMKEHGHKKSADLSEDEKSAAQAKVQELVGWPATSGVELSAIGRELINKSIDSLKGFALSEDGSKHVTGMDCVTTLNTLTQGVKGEQGVLLVLSTRCENALTHSYNKEISSAQLKEGTETLSLSVEATNLTFISSLNEMKQAIQKTFDKLPKNINTQIKTFNETYHHLQSSLDDSLKGSPMSDFDWADLMKDTASESHPFIKANSLFKQLSKVEQKLLALRYEPYRSSPNVKMKNVCGLLAELNDALMTLSKEASPPALLIQQLQHYSYLLQGNLPYSFNKAPLVEHVLEPRFTEDDVFGELPKHWQVKLKEFTGSVGGEEHLFLNQYNAFRQGVVKLNRFELPEEDKGIKGLLRFWASHTSELFEVAKFKGIAKLKVAVLASYLKDPPPSSAANKSISHENKELLSQLTKEQKQGNLSAYQAFWNMSVPNLLALATEFEVQNNLVIGSVTDNVYGYISKQLKSTNTPGLTLSQSFDLENSEHFSLLTKRLLQERLLKQPQEALSRLRKEHDKLEGFVTALNELKAKTSYFSFLGNHQAVDKWAQWADSFVGRFDYSAYNSCARKIEGLFTDCQPLLAQENTLFTADYLNDLSILKMQENLPHLARGAQSSLSARSDLIKEKAFTLSLRQQLETYYDEKIHDKEQNKTDNKHKLLNSIANKMILTFFRARVNKQGKVVYREAPAKNNVIQHYFYEPQKFCDAVEAAMSNAAKEQVDIIMKTSSGLSNQTSEALEDRLNAALSSVFKQQLAKKHYYIQLKKMEGYIEAFKEYLDKSQWFTEDKESKRNKLDLLNGLQTDLEDKTVDIETRFKNIQTKILDRTYNSDGKTNQREAKAFKQLLTQDMKPNFWDYSQTLLFLGYLLVQLYRAVIGVFTRTNDTNDRDVLAEKLVQVVIEPLERELDCPINDAAEKSFEREDRLDEGLVQEDDNEIEVNDKPLDSITFVRKYMYEKTGVSFFNPHNEGPAAEEEILEAQSWPSSGM